MISRAFTTLKDNKLLLLIPIAFDIFSFFVGLALHGFVGVSKTELKLNLTVGLPSIFNIVNDQNNFSTMNIQYDIGFGILSPAILFLFIGGLLIRSFLSAGFIGMLHDVANEKRFIWNNFFTYARKYWVSYFGLALVFIAFFLLSFFVIVIPLGFVGIILFSIVVITLRILYIYWEFTIIVDDLPLFAAFTKAREHFRNRTSDLTPIIFTIIGFNLIAALVVNGLWHPLTFFIAIFVFSYVATGLQLALMYSLHNITSENEEELLVDDVETE